MVKIDSYKVGTQFETTCAKRYSDDGEFKCYDSFEIIKEHAGIFGRKPEDVTRVKCTIIEEDIVLSDLYKDKTYDTNCTDYFGYIRMEDPNDMSICMIYANVKVYAVCFPYGADEARFWSRDTEKINYKTGETTVLHKAGDRKGMTVRLKIEEI